MNPVMGLSAACAEGLRANADRFLAFIGPGPLELQILGAPDRFAPNRFCYARSVDDAVALLDVAEKLAPTGTYFILNAPDEAVTTRIPMGKWHPTPKGGGATTDADIRARRALYIDVDAKRVKGTSATHAELACALATTERVYALLERLVGADALAVGHSGNGGSVFIALDAIPETPELAALCKGILAAVAARFGNEPGSSIDTSVGDAKRLCPAFGTTKRKGAPGIAERPHRPTGIATPSVVRRLSHSDLEGLLEKLCDGLETAGRAAVDKAIGRKPAAPVATASDGPAPAAGPNDPFARAKTVPIRDVLSWLSLLDTATDQPTCPGCALSDHGVAIVKNGLKCSHNRCSTKGHAAGFRTTIDVVMEACKVEKSIDAVRILGDRFGFDVPAPPPRTPATSGGGPPSPARHRPLTDLGNAERFVAAHGQDLRHCASLGWLAYDGKRWARDELGDRMRRAKLTARSIYAEADAADDPGTHKATMAWARKSEGAERLSAMVRLAESDPSVAITVSELDADPWALNVQNGTIDLRTGVLRPHRQADLVTKIAGTAFDPTATCPLFERFLGKVFQENVELIAFVRRFMGYALTASVREQVLAFFYGAGANGKSTLIDLMIDLLGSNTGYASPAAPGILIAKRGETHPTELADLRGARLVTCVEIGDGKRFDEERVKALTGGDAIKARYMREDFFTFMPTHKLLLAANHKPTVRGTDHGIWRRILLVPFNVTFTGAEKDPELPAKLRIEMPGILRWAVNGCLEWQREGLKAPPAVLEATSDYRAAQDTFGAFINEKCVVRDYASAGASDLYALYRAWATASGETPMTQTRFGLSLGERGFARVRTSTKFIWRGLGILDGTHAGEAEVDGHETRASAGVGDPLCDEPADTGAPSPGDRFANDTRRGRTNEPTATGNGSQPITSDCSVAQRGSDGGGSDPTLIGSDRLAQTDHAPITTSTNAKNRAENQGSGGPSPAASDRSDRPDGDVHIVLYSDDDFEDPYPQNNRSYRSQSIEIDGETRAIGSDANRSPTQHDPSRGITGLLARLREVAPNLRLDAMGHVAGFGTLARWPEGLLEEFDANERAIREALRAEKRAASETTPEAAPSKKP